ncbi:transposase, partial [Escherichia coli]
ADRNRSHWSTSKTPSYTKSVSWQHHRGIKSHCWTFRLMVKLFVMAK